MARPHETTTIDGLSFRTEALPYDRATDILPYIGQIITRTIDSGIDKIPALIKSGKVKLDIEGVAKLLPLIAPMLVVVSNELAASAHGTSMLKFLEPRLLETTTVILPDDKGVKETKQLIHAADRAEVFDAHPAAYLPALFFAGRVTFARYFPVAAAAADGST